MMNLDPALNDTRRVVHERYAGIGLAIVRLTIGAMFVWVFFENLGKGAYTPAGYAGVINYYITRSHSPAVWKAILGFMARRRHGGSDASHDRNLNRSPAGHRSAHTPGGFCGVRVPHQPLDLGVGHLVDLGTAGPVTLIACAFCRKRGPNLGCRRMAGATLAVLSVVVI